MSAAADKIDCDVVIFEAGADAREEGLWRVCAMRLDVENCYVLFLFIEEPCQLLFAF
jgi:hypothetical protein